MKLAEIIRRFEKLGWTVKTRHDQTFRFPPSVTSRHARIPPELTEFLAGVSLLENDTQTAWFLCENDFAGTSEAAFRWDEWERMSLEAAGNDRKLVADIRRFWDEHLPFLLSVRDGYAYFAIRTKDDGFGQIVDGREPGFEETSQVAPSFESFLSLLLDGSIQA